MFGYKCEECGTGTVRPTVRPRFEVTFDHVPFVIGDAVIGICDACGAEHFSGQEYKRWRELFQQSQQEQGCLLAPGEIREIRERLGMTMTDLAGLIGTTRQSLHHWEKDNRVAPQGRMADLMLRLVRESCESGSVNVLDFLVRRADQVGVRVSIATPGGKAPQSMGRRAPLEAYDNLYKGSPRLAQFRPTLYVITKDAA